MATENGMAMEDVMVMDKGTYLGKVTLDVWDNALPDVDFQPETGELDAFTWRHITIMKSGLTKAMKSYITNELRVEREAERVEREKSSKVKPVKQVEKTPATLTVDEKKEIADAVDDITTAPTKEDGGVDPALAKVKAARGHIPEGLDDVGAGGVRSGFVPPALTNDVKLTPFEIKQNKRAELKEKQEEVALVIDKPTSKPVEEVEVKVKKRFANSPA